MQNRLLVSVVVDVGSVWCGTGWLLLSGRANGNDGEWFVCMCVYGLHTTGGCPPGSVTQVDASGNYLNCNPFSPTSGCQPVGHFKQFDDVVTAVFQSYSCQYVQLNNRYQCCGAAPTNVVCSNGGTAQMSNSMPVTCTLSNTFVCATPLYTCLPTTTGSYACCSQGGGGGGETIPSRLCTPRACPVQVNANRVRSSPMASV